ncbi:hypothetical protein M2171_005500 [Bradyrhizobium japonicum USDA 38]|uniref:hypothetical protein n=1 Tax=Bradyrhizobium TaxID=374 RepID=UPI001269D981|nr:hypothetical protein [Bradyrhizobium japonicum]MCS3896367.1 hypothetical protein [Bradyrhizobium japonicum USDA 38]MCS3948881.1 hypothetical protein [Bradyrhizobium japonicum]MCW2218419.1 hypothetical protein [Bradyrhizobium japonicum]MCW2343033.1 hypothetical protein [Bradyrhizobium japonicum]
MESRLPAQAAEHPRARTDSTLPRFPLVEQSSGGIRREIAAFCPVFKKHAILVEFEQDRKCATATKRRRSCPILRATVLAQ